MRKKYFLVSKTVFFSALFHSHITFSQTVSEAYNWEIDRLDYSSQEGSVLVVNSLTIDDKKLLQVSFNSDEGINAKLEIYDQNENLVLVSNIELIPFPYYASIDIAELYSGSYYIRLRTKDKMYYSSLIVP